MNRAFWSFILISLLAAPIAPTRAEGASPRITYRDGPLESRVEIALGETPFRIERSDAQAFDLVTPAADLDFDLSQFTATPPDGRIVGARLVPDEAGARVRFAMDCECEYAMALAGGVLTIVFRDPAPAVVEAKPPPKTVKSARPAPERAPPPLPRGGRLTAAGSTSPEVAEPTPPKAEEIALARERLMTQLARAADQGLLEFTSPDVALPAPPFEGEPPREEVALTPTPSEAPAEVEPEAEAPPPPTTTQVEPSRLELPVRAHTAWQKGFPGDRGDTIVRNAPCVPAEWLDTAAWVGDSPLAEAVGQRRSALLDEFDQPQPNTVRALARLYVSHGLGYEALTVLDAFGKGLPDRALLGDLALTLEGLPPTADGPLASSDGCDGAAALWRLAAGLRASDPPEKPDQDGFSEALSTLSPDLRTMLGPMIMDSLVGAGDVDTAERIQSILRRAPGAFGLSYDLAEARLFAAKGEFAAAEAIYSSISQTATPEGQSAMLLLWRSLLDRGAPISGELSVALAEAAFLNRGGPLERPMLIASLRARSLTEGIGPTLDALSQALEQRPKDRGLLRDVGHAILETAVVAEGDGLSYAAAVLSYRDEIADGPAGDAARAQAAEQLLDLGLANAALEIAGPAMAREAPAARRAAARAFLALERPQEALDALGDLDDRAARLIRADAFERLGDHDRAKSETEPLADLDDETRARRAFLASDWSDAVDAGSAPRRLLAAWMAADGGDPPPGVAIDHPTIDQSAAETFIAPPALAAEVTLRDARAVLEASSKSRNIILEALEDG